MSEDVRVRYGRCAETNSPKNTLVTIRKDGRIYFGISRCLMSCDRPNKQVGQQLARFRADLAASDVAKTFRVQDGVVIHKSGMFGYTRVEDVTNLLSYFDNIDSIELARSRKNSIPDY